MTTRKNAPRNMPASDFAIADDYDWLDEDPVIPDQRFTLLSFHEPKDDTITLREVFFMSKFIEECLREDPEFDKKRVNFAKVSAEKLISLYHDFRYDNYEDLSKLAKEKYPTEMFERALKVRGCFKSHSKATDRMNELKKYDAIHSQYIAEVGKWLPFNPPESAIENYETSNKRLNEIIAAGRKNQVDAKEFYERERQERIKQEREINERRKRAIASNDEAAIVAEHCEQEALGLQPAHFTKITKRPTPSKAATIVADASPAEHGIPNEVSTKNYSGIRLKTNDFEHKNHEDFKGDGTETMLREAASLAGDVTAINNAKTSAGRVRMTMKDFDTADFDETLANNLIAKHGGAARSPNTP
jgi:hypothetical protein